MNKDEAIQVLNREVDKVYLPDVIIYWGGKNKELGDYCKFYAPKTGRLITRNHMTLRQLNTAGFSTSTFAERLNIQPDATRGYNMYHFVSARSYELELMYVKFHTDVEALEVSLVNCAANRGQENTPREFYKHELYRMLITKDCENIWVTKRGSYYSSECNYEDIRNWKQGERTKQIKDFFHVFCNCITNYKWLKKCTQNLAGVENYTAAGRYGGVREFNSWWAIEEWLLMQVNNRRKLIDTVNEEIEPLLCKNLEKYFNDVTMSEEQLKEYRNSWEYTSGSKYVTSYEKINNYDVFRMMSRTSGQNARSTNNDPIYHEKYRIIVGPDRKPKVYENYCGSFVRTTQNPSTNECKYYHYGFDNMKNSENLKYISSLINESNEPVNSAIGLLRHPIVEKIIKSGYPNIAKSITRDGTIQANIKSIFDAKEKSGDLYKALGVNKYIMKAMENQEFTQNRIYYYPFVKIMKEITGINNLAALDKDTCEMLIHEISHNLAINRGCLYHLDFSEEGLVDTSRGYWGYWGCSSNFENRNDETRRYVFKLMKNEYSDFLKDKNNSKDLISVIVDTITTMKRIYAEEYRPRINFFNITNYDEAIITHNNVVELQRQYQEERDRFMRLKEAEKHKIAAEKMDKIYKSRIEKFGFEDDNFKIVVPRTPADLVNEGSDLHHCVGGYIERVANKDTNIIFIRKKNDENQSYLTVEVNNDNKVIQAHAKYNAWMGTIPEVIPFFIKWIRNKGISCDNHIILSTATGYCSNGFKELDGTQFGL